MAWTVVIGGKSYPTSGSRAEAENLYNVLTGGSPFDESNYVTGSDSQGATTVSPSTTSPAATTATGQTYNTVSGPRTVNQMADELAAAGYNGPWDDASIVAAYQRTAGGGGGAGGGAGGGRGTQSQVPVALLNNEANLLNQEFLRIRLRDLEIPQYRSLDQRERIRLALEATDQFARNAGYVVSPQAFRQFVGLTGPEYAPQGGGGGGTAPQAPQLVTDGSGAAYMVSGGKKYWIENGDVIPPELRGQIKLIPRDNNQWYNFRTQFDETSLAGPGETQNTIRSSEQFNQIWQAGQAPATQAGMGVGVGATMGGFPVMPTLEREKWQTDVMANPRNLAQSLLMMGLSPEQSSNFLKQTPLYKQLVSGAINPLEWGQTGGGRSTNPLFPFISGRQLPVRQTLEQLQSGSQQIPLLQGLFSYSGQEPSAAFGEFASFLPKGGQVPLSAFI